MLIIPPIVAFGLSLSGIIEPDTFARQHIRALTTGIIIPFIPWFLAPKHKTISGRLIGSIYLILGIFLTVLMYSDPHRETLGQIFILIGMIVGMSIIGYQYFVEQKPIENNP